ncbi:MAG: ABC transporter substrate-binding protein [Chloroflexi bacterium]|nr:ABC transporter substrate-binding protein [Chloroflexota bacterium]
MLVGLVVVSACTTPTTAPTTAPTQPPAAAPTKAAAEPTKAAAAPTSAPAAATKAPAPTSAPVAPGQLPRNETLYIGGFQWGPPATFNPLAGVPAWPSTGIHEQIYETLFAFNVATGNLDPLLAKEYKFTDATTVVITLQNGTQWQDGKPLTTDDVVYTFGLAKTNKDLVYSDFWRYVTEMTSTGDRTIQLKLDPKVINPGIVKQRLATTRILPKHIWTEREKSGTALSQIVDNAPVGSGPYKLQVASAERVALVRDDNYWGKSIYGAPAPKYIVHPIFKSNDDGNLAFQRGEVDISQQFTPQIWLMWEQKKQPVGTWFKQEPYYIPGSIPMMHINTSKKGLDNLKVRRALAYSINYPLIAQTAMSRYSAPVQSSLILPTGGEAKYFNAEQTKSLGWEYNPAKAKEILEKELSAKKGADGIYVLPDGTRLGPWKVITPYGWTDWMTALSLVSQSAKEIGIDINTEFPEQPVVTSRVRNGDFDFALFGITGATPAAPWQRIRDMIDDRDVPDRGTQAFWNFGRFKPPAGTYELLDKAAAATDEATQKQLFGQLDKIFIENIPGIGLMYRPLEFYEFNETVWTGFPTSDNPWAPPMHQQAGIKILYKIKPK